MSRDMMLWIMIEELREQVRRKALTKVPRVEELTPILHKYGMMWGEIDPVIYQLGLEKGLRKVCRDTEYSNCTEGLLLCDKCHELFWGAALGLPTDK